MYNIKPGQLVEVHWIDPASASDWKNAEAVSFYEFRCQSVGWVHFANDVGLVLTACYGCDLNNDRSLLLRQHLPWTSITDLWVLNVTGR